MTDTSPTAVLRARRVFDGERWHSNYAVLLRGDRIDGVVPVDEVPEGLTSIDLGDAILAPGLIDIQVNGGGGVLFNNQPDAETVHAMVAAHLRYGTTGLMPTVISDSAEVHRAAVEAVTTARANAEHGVLGIHLEGPFLNKERRGTHSASMIRQADHDDIAWLCSLDAFPVIVTVAPEKLQAGQLRRLSDAGLLVSAGHTNASHACVTEAIAQGLRGFTHLFNAMSPLTAREPGTVGAALEDHTTWAGIIADGHHVHPATLSLAHRCKPAGKLLLVSDAMATVGAKEQGFELYGERIEVQRGKLINTEGNLAGSAIALIDAVRTAHQLSGIELGECLRMASLYPAAFLRLENQLGRIAPGFRADLFAFTSSYAVTDSWVAGQHTRYHNS